MITIITGVPGAGKTLYTIDKLVRPLLGQTVTYKDANGDEVTAPRTIYTNINGALFDHELIDGGDNQGLRDWHKWAKPGSVIVFDEFQKIWPPRANGSKIPEEVQTLDTHRHMGVDFILVTQNVMNTDRHIHALGGRHLHVRRMGNMKLAVVYEWDHVSRSLQYGKAITKSPWRYDKRVFELYKSAEVHTKQPRKMPGLIWFVLLALIGAAILGPVTYTRLQERINPGAAAVVKPPTEADKALQAMKRAEAEKARQPAAPAAPVPAPAPVVPTVPAAPVVASAPPPVFAGCAAAKGVCSCYDTAGMAVEREPEFCTAHTGPGRAQLGWVGGSTPAAWREPVHIDRKAELDMLASVARQVQSAPTYTSLHEVQDRYGRTGG